MSQNPYSPPPSFETPNSNSYQHEFDQLAGRGTRFVAAFLDGLFMLAMIVPILLLTGLHRRITTEQVSVVEQLLMSLLGILLMLLLNGYILQIRGQTIGKMIMKIQIVDNNTRLLLPFWRVYLLRYLWSLPLTIFLIFVPGQIDDQLINIVVLVDALIIFGSASRCGHDYIAGSCVVEYDQFRERLG